MAPPLIFVSHPPTPQISVLLKAVIHQVGTFCSKVVTSICGDRPRPAQRRQGFFLDQVHAGGQSLLGRRGIEALSLASSRNLAGVSSSVHPPGPSVIRAGEYPPELHSLNTHALPLLPQGPQVG